MVAEIEYDVSALLVHLFRKSPNPVTDLHGLRNALSCASYTIHGKAE